MVGKEITLTIDGSPVAFPAVRMHASATGAGVAVQLTTPGDDDQTANSIYFDVTVPDADDPAGLPGTEWHFHSDDAERLDTLNGIFLYGHAAALEPRDVTISFGESGGAATVELDGQFRLFDPADSGRAEKTVAVHGRFNVER
jgi:hypothetical protein